MNTGVQGRFLFEDEIQKRVQKQIQASLVTCAESNQKVSSSWSSKYQKNSICLLHFNFEKSKGAT